MLGGSINCSQIGQRRRRAGAWGRVRTDWKRAETQGLYSMGVWSDLLRNSPLRAIVCAVIHVISTVFHSCCFRVYVRVERIRDVLWNFRSLTLSNTLWAQVPARFPWGQDWSAWRLGVGREPVDADSCLAGGGRHECTRRQDVRPVPIWAHRLLLCGPRLNSRLGA